MKWHVKRNNVHSYIAGELRLRRGSKAASTCLEQKLFFKSFLFLPSNVFPTRSQYFSLNILHGSVVTTREYLLSEIYPYQTSLAVFRMLSEENKGHKPQRYMISDFVFPHITNSNYRCFKTSKNFAFIKVDNFKYTFTTANVFKQIRLN